MSVRAFYDRLAPLYHLIYEDWEATATRQGAALASLIDERWGPGARSVLDAAVGIGTQALGLLARGFRVIGSDLSPRAVERARGEATRRGLALPALVADFRALPLREASVDVVVVADNALPHLDTDAEIAAALAECRRCARPGGGCLVTLRDYGTPPPAGTVEEQPYGERTLDGRRYRVRQTRTWQGPRYEVAFEFVPLDGGEGPTVPWTSYRAIPVERVAALMRDVGLVDVLRLDGRFFQPVLLGTRPRA
jgi:SAM-dependent methyltransferase